jgi:hypothetical protein
VAPPARHPINISPTQSVKSASQGWSTSSHEQSEGTRPGGEIEEGDVKETLIVLGIALTAALAGATGPPTLEERAAAIDAASAEPDGERVVAGHVSRKLVMAVDVLRTERAQTGLGWGELLIAHLLSREAGLAVGDVAALFRNGQGWSEIARDHGVALDTLSGDVQRSQEAIEQRSEDRVRTEATSPSRSRAGKSAGKGGSRR